MYTRLTPIFIVMFGILLAIGITCQQPTSPPTVIEIVSSEEDAGLIRTDFGQQVHWDVDVLPLMVILDKEMSDWNAEIEFSISLWNRVVDGPIFIYAGIEDASTLPTMPTHGIIVIRKADFNAYPHVQLRFNQQSGSLISAPVYLPGGYSQYRLRTAAHELGHVLGLEHDEELPQSVMHPSVRAGKWVVTNNDRNLLLSWYNPDKLIEEHIAVSTGTISTAIPTACDEHCHQVIRIDEGTTVTIFFEHELGGVDPRE